jgi:hypothetical protein
MGAFELGFVLGFKRILHYVYNDYVTFFDFAKGYYCTK